MILFADFSEPPVSELHQILKKTYWFSWVEGQKLVNLTVAWYRDSVPFENPGFFWLFPRIQFLIPPVMRSCGIVKVASSNLGHMLSCLLLGRVKEVERERDRDIIENNWRDSLRNLSLNQPGICKCGCGY